MSEEKIVAATAVVNENHEVELVLYSLSNELNEYRIRIFYPGSQQSAYFNFNGEKHAQYIQEYLKVHPHLSSFDLNELSNYLIGNQLVAEKTLNEFWQERPSSSNAQVNFDTSSVIANLNGLLQNNPQLLKNNNLSLKAQTPSDDRFLTALGAQKKQTKMPIPASLASATSANAFDLEVGQLALLQHLLIKKGLNPEEITFKPLSSIYLQALCPNDSQEAFKAFLDENNIKYLSAENGLSLSVRTLSSFLSRAAELEEEVNEEEEAITPKSLGL